LVLVVEPSLRVCKPAHSELVHTPGNREGCSGKSIWRKHTLDWDLECMAMLTVSLICVAAAGLLVVMK